MIFVIDIWISKLITPDWKWPPPPSPFGTFPKIHLLWYGKFSLTKKYSIVLGLVLCLLPLDQVQWRFLSASLLKYRSLLEVICLKNHGDIMEFKFFVTAWTALISLLILLCSVTIKRNQLVQQCPQWPPINIWQYKRDLGRCFSSSLPWLAH